MSEIKPLSPNDVKQQIASGVLIPEFVIAAFNELLVEKFSGNRAVIKQGEIKARIKKLTPTNIEFDYKWLDVEPYYRAHGWKVRYDKPHYSENYEAYYEFTPA